MKPPRPPVAILLLFLAVLVAWLVFRPRPTPTSTAGAPTHRDADGAAVSSAPPASPVPAAVSAPATASPPPAPAAPLAPSPAAVAAGPSAPPVPDASGATNLPAAARPENASVNAIRVRRMITDYHTLTGENPVGTNAEIMAAVMGKNPRQATLGPPEGIRLNPEGELVDEWGTPYFFHQLSRDSMEIHSAGPDKTMGTADDIVVR